MLKWIYRNLYFNANNRKKKKKKRTPEQMKKYKEPHTTLQAVL